MADSSEPNRDNLIMEEFQINHYFRHSWWRILLIVTAFLSFILTCIFNGLASQGPNGVFTRQTGRVSDENPTEFTPAGWTFSIWGIIYFWQAAWLIYAISRIPRKSNIDYLYIHPNTLHFTVFIIYIINMALNITWLVVWDRGYFGWSFFILLAMFITIVVPMAITHILLGKNRQTYVNSNRTLDIWLVRIFVHNGLAIYGTWLYLATLLNLTVWISQIYNKDASSVADASTAALSLVLIAIFVYYICENIIFYSSMAYTFLPWFVLIFALTGIISKNAQRTDVSHRNKTFAIALLIICCILFFVRLIVFIVRYVKKQIPTVQDP
ncbi:unnamed protein product [Adineta ricciae]|uniref:Uncharacterized protein n=1 Tax=Adineta ricciae TaxID=249248 RepID=A0A814N975_ADIRI|nr:unnamed protein product [Adineta ricciae]